MKRKIHVFASMFVCMVLSCNPAWSADKTITITATALNLGGSYSSSSASVGEITISWTDLMKNSDNIQAKASSAILQNTTATSGRIKSVVVTHSGTARSTSISFGTTTACGSESTTWTGSKTISPTGDYTYFKITRGSNAAYWTNVVVTYESGSTKTLL